MEFYRGLILNPIENFNIDYFQDGLLSVDKGKIQFCGEYKVGLKNFQEAKEITRTKHLIIPGFIDLHTHIPQFPAIGKGEGELLPWLNEYIFPLEEKFKNPNLARKVSKRFFKKLIENGTTTAVIFSNSSFEATDIIFQEANKSGVRVFIGNSIMDINAPDSLIYSIETNISNMNKLIEKWHLTDKGRLNFIVSPRYAGSCSIELMKEAAKLAKQNDLFIQTHLAENKDEIKFISSTHNFKGSYTELLFDSGIITPKSLLAHCIYLDEKEIDIIKQNDASIVHCPTSNRYLRSGIMPLKKYLIKNLKIGLGTDIAGGYNVSVLRETKEAIENSKYYSLFLDKTSQTLNKQEAFWISTLGNAKILKLDNIIGSLSAGKEADFIVLDSEFNDIKDYRNIDDVLSELIYSDSLRIRNVAVRGQMMYQN